MVPRIVGVMILLIYLAFISASFVWAGIWDTIKGHYVFRWCALFCHHRLRTCFCA